MRVFLAGIMQGSFQEMRIVDQSWRDTIKASLARHLPAAEVYCHFEAHPESVTYERPEIVRTLTDGFRRAAECDVLVAYLPSASMGTAIEMYEAARCGAVVLTITPLAVNWVVMVCSDKVFPNMADFEEFLAGGRLAELLMKKGRANPEKNAP
ncbi:MAG TPA: hypothetical protein VMV94_13230 [Phycisphaerae bacterium]|nr:hypothetical protein [Phycisphaerae bacterium]